MRTLALVTPDLRTKSRYKTILNLRGPFSFRAYANPNHSLRTPKTPKLRIIQFTIFILHFSIFNSLPAAEPLRKTLTSVDQNIHVETWETILKGNASVRKQTLRGGKQEGVDVITVNNGKLKFTIIPTRGMSIAEVVMD